MRVTFEHNLSIVGAFVEHNSKIFGAVQHTIIGHFLSIIGSTLIGSAWMAIMGNYLLEDFYIFSESANIHAHLLTLQNILFAQEHTTCILAICTYSTLSPIQHMGLVQ